jgi:hypothetical protein
MIGDGSVEVNAKKSNKIALTCQKASLIVNLQKADFSRTVSFG